MMRKISSNRTRFYRTAAPLYRLYALVGGAVLVPAFLWYAKFGGCADRPPSAPVWLANLPCIPVESPIANLVQGIPVPLLVAIHVAIIAYVIVASNHIFGGSSLWWEVSLDDENLYVSNFSGEFQIPLSNIDRVTETRWQVPKRATIHLKSPAEFGDTLVFLPTDGLFTVLGMSHPVIAELNTIAQQHVAA